MCRIIRKTQLQAMLCLVGITLLTCCQGIWSNVERNVKGSADFSRRYAQFEGPQVTKISNLISIYFWFSNAKLKSSTIMEIS